MTAEYERDILAVALDERFSKPVRDRPVDHSQDELDER